MMTRNIDLDLRPDELAFRFDTDRGVDVEHLATFLQRVTTVSRRAGTEFVVVGVPDGSVIVKLRAVAKRANREFMKAPLAGAAAAMAVGGGIAGIGGAVTAIVHAMVPSYAKVSPIAKAGAVLVEDHHVEKIEIITNNQTIVVMDGPRAAQIRMLEEHRKAGRGQKASYAEAEMRVGPSVPHMIVAAREGTLSGEILDVDGEMHFRPDGYRYLVPVDADSTAYRELGPGAHVRVQGEIVARRGQPDRIVIDAASAD